MATPKPTKTTPKLSRRDKLRAMMKVDHEDGGLLASVKRVLAARGDSWLNPYTGYGTTRDKTAVGYFSPELFVNATLWLNLYEGDPIAAKIVDLVPQEMLRQGFALTYKDDDDAETSGDEETEEKLTADFVRLNAGPLFEDGIAWGRCTGGALMFVVCDDGMRSDAPLDIAKIRSVTSLKVYDRTRVTIEATYTDPKSSKFGKPKVYRIDPLDGVEVGEGGRVHESRCIRFGGVRTSDRTRLALSGWDMSILQRVYDGIRKFHEDHKVSSLLMSDASQGVLKMSGVIDMIAAGEWAELQARLMNLEMLRGVARAIVVDPEEEEDFTKIQNSFAGISDILDRDANYLAAITGIPVTVLMGQAPAGLSATGDSDIRLFYDRVRTEQQNELKPRMMRLVEILTRGNVRGWDVTFPPLWQESPPEKADRQLKEAQRDQIYVTIETATPEEIALSPHLDDVYPNLDREARRAMLEAEAQTATLTTTTPANENAPPGEPAAPAKTEDDEAAVQDDEAVRRANEMNAWIDPETGKVGDPMCEHLCSNRCRKCGIERVRAYEFDENGKAKYDPVTKRPVHAIKWRAIGRKVASNENVQAEELGEKAS
jgi:phage-related protein (TIGR01555 family)